MLIIDEADTLLSLPNFQYQSISLKSLCISPRTQIALFRCVSYLSSSHHLSATFPLESLSWWDSNFPSDCGGSYGRWDSFTVESYTAPKKKKKKKTGCQTIVTTEYQNKVCINWRVCLLHSKWFDGQTEAYNLSSLVPPNYRVREEHSSCDSEGYCRWNDILNNAREVGRIPIYHNWYNLTCSLTMHSMH